MRFLGFLFLSLTIFGASQRALAHVDTCESKITRSQGAHSTASTRALTLSEAEAILGNYNPDTENGGGPGQLVRRAVQYLLTHDQHSVPEATYNLEVLLSAVRYLCSMYVMYWKANRIESIDGAGTVGFVGDAGHAIVINAKGEIYRGTIYIDKSRYAKPFAWNGDYSKMTKVGQIPIAPVVVAFP